GQVPQKPAVDRAECEAAICGLSPGTFDVVEKPGKLRCGEVWVKQQARSRHHVGLQPVSFKRGAGFGRTPVLPNDRRSDGMSGLTIPKQSSLALIGDAATSDLVCRHSGLC